MPNLKERYYDKANNLMERLLGEQPEVEEEPTDEFPGEDEETTEVDVEEEPEQGQAEQIEIFFDSLDEKSQKVLIDALKENLNIAEDDEYAHQKLVDSLAKEPLITFRAEELVRKLNLDI
jgi:hypothetical protein